MATNLSLSEVTNTYGTYRGNSLVGPLSNVATVPNDGLSGIIGVNFPFLAGMIIKINGQSYAYSGWLNAVKLKGNPYLSKRSLPTISFTLNQLVNTPIPETIVHNNPETNRTQYAEINISKKMSTINDVLFYLNDFFNPKNSDEVLGVASFGAWTLNTTEYDVELDVVGAYPGFQFEEFGEDLQPPPSSLPTETEAKLSPPEPIVEIAEEQEINVVKPNITLVPEMIIQPDISDFLLNDSVDFSREIFSTPIGLRDTGLRDAYDTGDYGPMAEILGRLESGGSSGGGARFGRFGGSSGRDPINYDGPQNEL